MLEAWSQMLWPLLACFILVGIHAYLGIHVIARKVIFVDLALAQIAGLGAVYGVFLGLSFDTDVLLVKLVSVIFTLLGAWLFSMTRTENEHIPHEAIIGIIYAAALSMTVLMTANLPHGADEVQQMLAGSILWVSPREVLYTGLLYAIVGLFHWACRRQFFALSNELALRHLPTGHTRLWDFLFYATFGVVVTSSVGIGGVLLVFGFLVIPSVIGVLLATKTKTRLLIGWGSGIIASVIGVWFSYYLDLPSGPTIVVFLGLLLAAVAIYREFRSPVTRRQGLGHGLLALALAIVFIFLPQVLKISQANSAEKVSRRHQLGHENITEKIVALENMLSSSESSEIISALNEIDLLHLSDLMPRTLNFLADKDALVREKAITLQAIMSYRPAIPHLKNIFGKESDDFVKIGIADALLSLGDLSGFDFLLELRKNSSELVRSDALSHFRKWLVDAPEADDELEKMVKKRRDKIQFDPEKRKFFIGD
jgi:zinc/manganese transport system permease protein